MLAELLAIDKALFLAIIGLANPILDFILPTISYFGLIWIWLAIALLVLFKDKKASIALLLGLAIDVALVIFLKTVISRPRPFELLNARVLGAATGSSFPSGHAQTSFLGATILGNFYPKLRAGLFALAILVGISRIYIGVHWPLDVAAGAINGIIIGLIVLRLPIKEKLEKHFGKYFGKSKRKISKK